ncbi:MAG TPA: hypothetical protein VED40_23505 [Azospirillaceae bacterium]|nr:hypothetical protein [Azospirillaceae bacterium]
MTQHDPGTPRQYTPEERRLLDELTASLNEALRQAETEPPVSREELARMLSEQERRWAEQAGKPWADEDPAA